MPQQQTREPRDDHRSRVAADWRDDVAGIVADLNASRELTHNIRQNGRIRDLPSQEALVKVLARLSSALFPAGRAPAPSRRAARRGRLKE